MSTHPAVARKTALKWLEIYLDDQKDLEELWGTYLEDAWEEPPITRAEFDVLMPQVFAALREGQPLPKMDDDVKSAICQYLEDGENTIRTSILANSDDDDEPTQDWIDAVSEAYQSLYQPLRS